ncbi:MAG: AAA family ATPase, partial [Candidatus Binatia bacterium]
MTAGRDSAAGGGRAAVFVGRERELGELRAGLDDALAGRGRLFLIAGDAGIGKTRLAHEIHAVAEAAGARVRWARCWEGGGAPAFWPWIVLLRAALRECDT